MDKTPDLEQVVSPAFSAEAEADLLRHDPDQLRNLYALTGPARKEYIGLLAEADAARVERIAKAQAEGILAIRKAEAEGYRLIGEALASSKRPELVIEIARLHTAQRIAKSLADGQATKLILPTDLSQVVSMVTALADSARKGADATPNLAGGSSTAGGTP